MNESLFSQLHRTLYAEAVEWNKTKSQVQCTLGEKEGLSKDEPIVKVQQWAKTGQIGNESDRPLSDTESELLMKGLNYAVTPTQVPVDEYIIALENACRFTAPQQVAVSGFSSMPPTPNSTSPQLKDWLLTT